MADNKDIFWKEYIELDYFGRRNKLKELGLFQGIQKLVIENKEPVLVEYVIVSSFQSYIDDLIEILRSGGNGGQ